MHDLLCFAISLWPKAINDIIPIDVLAVCRIFEKGNKKKQKKE